MFKKYFENFKKCTAINEDFDQTEYVPLAMNYLKKRFGDNDYVHKPLLTDANLKYFDVSVKGKTFTIAGRKHDTEPGEEKNTIVFKIIRDEDEEVKSDEF